jgi:fucose 4-O-acetylase-like acetyltransferase
MAVVFWLYLGVFFRREKLLNKITTTRFISYKVIFIVMIWAISVISGCTHLYENYYRLGLIDVLGAICGAVLMLFCGYLLQVHAIQSIKNTASWLGRNTMSIYIIHFWTEKMFPFAGALNAYTNFPDTVKVLICFVLEVGVAVVGTLIMSGNSLWKSMVSGSNP